MKIIKFTDIDNMNIPLSDIYSLVSDMIKNKKTSHLPPKVSMHPSDEVFCNIMPCMIPNTKIGFAGGVKIVNRYPDRKPSLDSQLMLMNMETGDFLALMDANWITAMRTGAVAAHSVEKLAKENFETIAFVGLGNTARATLLFLLEIFKNRKFKIKLLKYKDQAELFIKRFEKYDNIEFEIIENNEQLVSGSDVIISCVTYFDSNFCDDGYYKEGVLVVPVHTRGFMNCDLFFDKVYADDYGHVCHFGNFDKFKSFAEVCDVVNKKARGRENDKERILAYNIGLAIHDINLAAYIYDRINKDSHLVDIDLDSPKEKFWV